MPLIKGPIIGTPGVLLFRSMQCTFENLSDWPRMHLEGSLQGTLKVALAARPGLARGCGGLSFAVRLDTVQPTNKSYFYNGEVT